MAHLQQGRNVLRQFLQVRNGVSQSFDRVMHHPLLYACQGVRYRKLDVILTTSVDKLGKAGESVKVAPGYFRNHLMPKLLAVPNIEKFAYLVREQRKMYQPIEVEEVKVVKEIVEDAMKEYQKAAKRLDNAKLVLRRYIDKKKMCSRATKDEPIELQSPVSKEEIVDEDKIKSCMIKQLCQKCWRGTRELQ